MTNLALTPGQDIVNRAGCLCAGGIQVMRGFQGAIKPRSRDCNRLLHHRV